jgi:hypothetical protein
MLFMEISRVGCEEYAEYKKACVDKAQSDFCYTRHQAAYIARVDATVIYKGLIQMPYAFLL